MIRNCLCFSLILFFCAVFGQKKALQQNAKNQNNQQTVENFTNPILPYDYSDPDVVKVGDQYYMTASSFNCIPGLPILESNDLVNWKLIGYALKKLQPEEVYNKVQHGKGVWAPCIRYHQGEFYIYYPDPDFGIFMIKSKSAIGPWSEPIMVKAGKGLIDPSPLWDDDGKAYLVYAFAGSRAGIKSLLAVCTMNNEGTIANQDEVIVLDGHQDENTVEGPKFYKKNGFYYIFAPSGGVATGWQLVLRSKNIFGPYEKRKILEQGNTKINGPHQGAWISTDSGEDWFIHFQDVGAIGRIVHLQPMKWKNDWPIIGNEGKNGVGDPVLSYKKPNVGKIYPKTSQPDSDEFNETKLGLQWQWHANPQITWGFPTSLGYFMLNCIPKPADFHNLYDVSNLFLQKTPSNQFSATSKLEINLTKEGEEAGLVIMGLDYGYLRLKNEGGKIKLSQINCIKSDEKRPEIINETVEIKSKIIYLKVNVSESGESRFFFSENNIKFNEIGKPFKIKEGKWIGAKIGFVALREGFINDSGSANIDWIRFDK